MLTIDTSAIVVFIIVWILVAVLTKVFFEPLRKVMSSREQDIEGDKEASLSAAEEMERTLTRIEEEIRAARLSSKEARDRLELEAVKEKERMVAEVSRESREQVERAKKELEEHLERLKEEMREKSQEMAKNIEKRLLE